ncbi:MAG: hypothetical protein QHH15_00380 [Candidatus Thermoplasmatota archaeon]|nr:hypothetical protein [Candidatus Thermoplasmatota archaeon]MDH7506230.1 hypothetical protein [Candidatus Thermoplasmatota archaeon]
MNNNEVIDGQEIKDIRCLGSMYDRGETIEVVLSNDEVCRMRVKEFLKIVNGVKFNLKMKKKYRHLEIVGSAEMDKRKILKW